MTFGAVLAAAALVLLWISADRARTFAECTIDGGVVRVVRGKVPPALLADLRDVASRNRLRSGRLVIRKSDGRPALTIHGVESEAARQQLRNVVGRFSSAAFR
jgi:hypothetical protein